MKRSVFTNQTWLLLIAATLLVTAGVLNFGQRLRRETPPWDGVRWVDSNKGVIADEVTPNTAAASAWLLPGDRLAGISLDGVKTDEIVHAREVQMYLDQAGVAGQIHYSIERPSYPPESRYYVADLDNLGSSPSGTPRDLYINLIGVVYLFVGLFVLFRQGGRAPFVLHFATWCVTAFVLHFYTPTGSFRDLDLAVAFLRNTALIMFAPLFVHFCARYPLKPQPGERRWTSALVYLPAAILLVLANFVFLRDVLARVLPAVQQIPHLTDSGMTLFYRAAFFHFLAGLVIGAVLLVKTSLTTKSAVVRQQLKWVIWGSLLAVAPFTVLYAIGYLFGAQSDPWVTDAAVLPLILIPLAFGYSVLRYRLMDVELVVRRVFVYALTTLAIAVMIGAVVYLAGLYAFGNAPDSFSSGQITLRVVVAIVAMAAIVIVAGPVKAFLQERVDRLFYGERYDLRNSLLEFGRTLSAATALDPLLDSLIKRLQEVMDVERIAIFIEDQTARSGYRVARSVGLESEIIVPPDFREMIRVRSAEMGVVRADDLDVAAEATSFVRRALHYYVPCVVRGRMVAVIGLGRSADGALLSSEDVEILRTVSGYVAVAIENGLLYQEQQQRAAELKLLKEFNESIVESINVGLLAVDLKGKVTHLNTALEKILDIKRGGALGRPVEELFSEDFSDTLWQVLSEDGWRLKEIRNIYKLHTATVAGRTVVLNIAIAPLQDAQTQTGALVVVEDVTTRIRLEEQLQQREKLSSIGLLAAGVAHEVNTPLTGVSSYSQLLLGMLSDSDPKHALLQKIQNQAERATNIVNNLLNFSRTGNATEFTEVDLSEVLDDTLQLLEPQLRRHQIEITRAYISEAPRVFGNRGKLQQVFTNLLLNARDAIPDGGRITISTFSTDRESVTVEVADTGIGIAAENVAKIYDPFYTTKGVGRGTGLGLAVTYGIVQEHAGHIGVESQPGRGTTFRITLPAAQGRARLQAVGD